MLIELQNGGIKEISTDTYSYGGCDTCDYGSSYINELEIELTQGTIYVTIDAMYDYALSDGYLIKLFIGNIDGIRGLTEGEFFEWFDITLRKEFAHCVDRCEFVYA